MLKETLNISSPEKKELPPSIPERSTSSEVKTTGHGLTSEEQERKQRLEGLLESLDSISAVIEEIYKKTKPKSQQEAWERGDLDDEPIKKVRKTIETLEIKLAVSKFISEDLSDADVKVIVEDLYIPLYRKDFLGDVQLEKNLDKFIEAVGLEVADNKACQEILPEMRGNAVAIESSRIHRLPPKKLEEIIIAIKKFCEQEKDEDITDTTVLAWVEPQISIKRGDEIKIVNDGIPVYTRIEKKADLLRSLEHNFGSLVSES